MKNIQVRKTERRLANENGSVMVIALMVLVIVSIIGVISINTSTVEIQVASSDRVTKENFYRAEGAAMEAAQRIENEIPANLRDKNSNDWLNFDDVDFEDAGQWTDDQSDPSPGLNADYAVNDDGIAHGSSLDMSNETHLHRFRVFGRFVSGRDRELIEIAYRRRF